jgi:two-component system response regulator YesN
MRLVEVLQSQKGEGYETRDESYFADIFERIRKNSSITELEGTLGEVIRYEIQVIDDERKKKANSIIEKVKNYIKDNLSEDLTLNAVSSIIYMNPVYFSTLFKQSTGINYHDYVFEEKMKIAQKLLIEDQKKIYEVSEMVGYVNARSFSEAFKRYWGDTPSNYVKEFFDNRGI